MKPKHTPGLTNRTLLAPWTVVKAKDTQSRLAIVKDIQGYSVTELFTRGTELEQNQVATLISAAPDMLDALENVLLLESGMVSEREVLNKVRAAIEKAKGE